MELAPRQPGQLGRQPPPSLVQAPRHQLRRTMVARRTNLLQGARLMQFALNSARQRARRQRQCLNPPIKSRQGQGCERPGTEPALWHVCLVAHAMHHDARCAISVCQRPGAAVPRGSAARPSPSRQGKGQGAQCMGKGSCVKHRGSIVIGLGLARRTCHELGHVIPVVIIRHGRCAALQVQPLRPPRPPHLITRVFS